MMQWHRRFALFASLFLAFIAVTGTGIQLADLRALVTHAPETDPDMRLMRQHIYGPPNYAVVSAPDYSASMLPRNLDLVAAIRRAVALGRDSAPGQPMQLVELRTAAGKPAVHVQMGSDHKMFDLATGVPLPESFLPPPQPGSKDSAPRLTFKKLHKFDAFGRQGTVINGLAAMALALLIVTGLFHYARLYKARAKAGRRSPWWRAGGLLRTLHRCVAITAFLPVLWIAISGFLLSVDNVGAFVHTVTHGPRKPEDFEGEKSSPLADDQVEAMTRTTLAAFETAMPGVGIKVLRLRTFVGYPQGVIVAGDAETSQFVFNAQTGLPMRMWEKGYPDLTFPAGWELHQKLKRIHRGDIFGLPGRWLDLAGALSLVYLSLSGIVMSFRHWRKHKKVEQR